MSKVSITIEVDRYICSELEEVRDMIKHLDFSGLSAAVERIQRHANAMESAIRNYNNYFGDIKKVLDNKSDSYLKEPDLKLTDKKKIEAITEILKKKYHDW